MRPCTLRIASAEDDTKAGSLTAALGRTCSLVQNRPKRTPDPHQPLEA
jgi:hypothetical protein